VPTVKAMLWWSLWSTMMGRDVMSAVRRWPGNRHREQRVRSTEHTLASIDMSGLAKAAPALKPFTLALIQLGNIGANKTDNLKHAREMIHKAVTNHGEKRPDLVVLPVCASHPLCAG
jgi:hypothetical protein